MLRTSQSYERPSYYDQRVGHSSDRRTKIHRRESSLTLPHGYSTSNRSQTTSVDAEGFGTRTLLENDRYGSTHLFARPRPRTLNHESSRAANIPSLRFSNSSGKTHVETPPLTPIEGSARNSLEPIRVVVAAPVADVGTMDALVDGMNGSDEDDMFRHYTGPRLGKTSHHPLYHPPLPVPPPGITLGGARSRKLSGNSSEEDHAAEEFPRVPLRPKRPSRRKSHHRNSAPAPVLTTSSSIDATERSRADSTPSSSFAKVTTIPSPSQPKAVVPSISEIIRKNAPALAQSSYRLSFNASLMSTRSPSNESHPQLEPLASIDESDIISRSSIDSIAQEVQQSILAQSAISSKGLQAVSHMQTFPGVASPISGNTSIQSDEPSWISSSSSNPTLAATQPSDHLLDLLRNQRESKKEAITSYVRSKRLTTLLKLTRQPHASREHPLTVSMSDLGSSTGYPLVVFLGLGCVRYIMGLYDEMAECLGLRLITIDRWGLGKTDVPRSSSRRGILEWATVVEEVLDLLGIERCSIMAHSAGAPYALSFASRYPERIIGDVCLLAPWVGGSDRSGYKWLKYVPNGLLKTAQAAEWKMQTWMIGKSPDISYEGIGYNVGAPMSLSSREARDPRHSVMSPEPFSPTSSQYGRHGPVSLNSSSSGTFSEYDDLADFDGRFASSTTLGRRQRADSIISPVQESKVADPSSSKLGQRKSSKGFLSIWRGGSGSPQTSLEKTSAGKKVKSMKSMGSLRGFTRSTTKTSSAPSTISKAPPLSPTLPEPTFGLEFGIERLDLSSDTVNQSKSSIQSSILPSRTASPALSHQASFNPRAGGRRSVSFTTSTSSRFQAPSTSSHGSPALDDLPREQESYQVALGNALMSSSHAESAKGTHMDLVQILNHDRKPWGFSYSHYPHMVKVWHGEKDERITLDAVRWLEKTMGTDRCHVKVIPGADHSLMFKSGIIVEVLEHVAERWKEHV